MIKTRKKMKAKEEDSKYEKFRLKKGLANLEKVLDMKKLNKIKGRIYIKARKVTDHKKTLAEKKRRKTRRENKAI